MKNVYNFYYSALLVKNSISTRQNVLFSLFWHFLSSCVFFNESVVQKTAAEKVLSSSAQDSDLLYPWRFDSTLCHFTQFFSAFFFAL